MHWIYQRCNSPGRARITSLILPARLEAYFKNPMRHYRATYLRHFWNTYREIARDFRSQRKSRCKRAGTQFFYSIFRDHYRRFLHRRHHSFSSFQHGWFCRQGWTVQPLKASKWESIINILINIQGDWCEFTKHKESDRVRHSLVNGLHLGPLNSAAVRPYLGYFYAVHWLQACDRRVHAAIVLARKCYWLAGMRNATWPDTQSSFELPCIMP